MECTKCGSIVPNARVEFLTERSKPITCLICSKEQKQIGFVVYGHKTAGSVITVPQNPDGTNDPEKIRIAQRAYRRSR